MIFSVALLFFGLKKMWILIISFIFSFDDFFHLLYLLNCFWQMRANVTFKPNTGKPIFQMMHFYANVLSLSLSLLFLSIRHTQMHTHTLSLLSFPLPLPLPLSLSFSLFSLSVSLPLSLFSLSLKHTYAKFFTLGQMCFFQVQTHAGPEGKLASRGNKTSLRVIQRYADTFEFQSFLTTSIIHAFLIK